MLKNILSTLLVRDLKKLYREIEMYQNEQNLWRIDKNITNSAGNLTLHLIGNLNTYIGNVIGSTSYVRNRENEFSLKNIPRHELLLKINETIEMVSLVIKDLNESELNEEYPVLVFEEKTSTQFLLIHLSTHLTYHLGQVNYHRRLLDY